VAGKHPAGPETDGQADSFTEGLNSIGGARVCSSSSSSSIF